MSQYSRKEKHQDSNKPSRSEKVKQSLSLFQMIVATIASLLGIIVTSFTIYSIMKPTTKTEEKKRLAPLALWLSMKRMDLLLIQVLPERTPVLAATKHPNQALNKPILHQAETSASEAPADTTPSATDTESSANQ